jgi:hypothetical protein
METIDLTDRHCHLRKDLLVFGWALKLAKVIHYVIVLDFQ